MVKQISITSDFLENFAALLSVFLIEEKKLSCFLASDDNFYYVIFLPIFFNRVSKFNLCPNKSVHKLMLILSRSFISFFVKANILPHQIH